jgi:hypothetical protein
MCGLQQAEPAQEISVHPVNSRATGRAGESRIVLSSIGDAVPDVQRAGAAGFQSLSLKHVPDEGAEISMCRANRVGPQQKVEPPMGRRSRPVRDSVSRCRMAGFRGAAACHSYK